MARRETGIKQVQMTSNLMTRESMSLEFLPAARPILAQMKTVHECRGMMEWQVGGLR